MLVQPSIDKLRSLKLNGMLKAYETLAQQNQTTTVSFEEGLGLLLDHEQTHREDKRLQRLLKLAKLRFPQACIEDVDYHHPRNLDTSQFRMLAQVDWVTQKHHLIIIGPTGAGKSYLACVLGQQACRHGLSAKYLRMSQLMLQLKLAHADGSYFKFMSQLSKINLLILDDWGLGTLKSTERSDLLEILEDRYLRQATLITSQLPIKNWHEFIGDNTVADAVLDRLMHNAYQLNLKGDSMRGKEKKVQGKIV